MRQIQFLEFCGDYDVCLISSDNQQHQAISRYLPDGTHYADSANGNYGTAKQLSEALRNAIGYGSARELLRKNGVADNDDLMYLGVNT